MPQFILANSEKGDGAFANSHVFKMNECYGIIKPMAFSAEQQVLWPDRPMLLPSSLVATFKRHW